ncbi:MAG: hypothetical protein GVY17_01020 [Cyanobacteria bacterium]|jgi:hypothetical protein|nr:hypothetical protein [Cyanobacteria bacterium GSL.Bin21]
MFKTLIIALIFTPTSALAFDPSILVEAQKENDIQDALYLNSTVNEVTTKIRACAKASNSSLKSCKCQAREEIDNLREVFKATLQEHPNWEDKHVRYPLNSNNETTTINMSHIKTALESPQYLNKPCS